MSWCADQKAETLGYNNPMLYTGKGDKGDTYFFGSKERFSKSGALAEALGSVDELNSWLGVCKVKSEKRKAKNIIEKIQEDLFIIQAALAGADKKISRDKTIWAEEVINDIEKKLPPIKTFFLPGGSEEGALLDYARAVARAAERRVIALHEQKEVSEEIRAYLNRLSSLLYALARSANAELGIVEKPPKYE